MLVGSMESPVHCISLLARSSLRTEGKREQFSTFEIRSRTRLAELRRVDRMPSGFINRMMDFREREERALHFFTAGLGSHAEVLVVVRRLWFVHRALFCLDSFEPSLIDVKVLAYGALVVPDELEAQCTAL